MEWDPVFRWHISVLLLLRAVKMSAQVLLPFSQGRWLCWTARLLYPSSPWSKEKIKEHWHLSSTVTIVIMQTWWKTKSHALTQPITWEIKRTNQDREFCSVKDTITIITSSNQRLWECVRCRINVYPDTLNDFPSWLSTSKHQPCFINNRGFTERYFSDKVHASLIDWWLRCVTAPISVVSHV